MRVVLKDSNEFKKLLIVKGFSQRALGRAAGITAGYASQICNGRRNPRPEVARKITEALKVGFDDIFFIDDACNSEHDEIAL